VAYKIFSTLDNEEAVRSPVVGPAGEVVDNPSFGDAHFGYGVFCDNGYVRFPTREGEEELVSNRAGSISLWAVPHFDNSGGFTGRMAVFSLYNDEGSHIIVFYDADAQRFGFSEAGVGEALEGSPRTVTPGEAIKICLTWDGKKRRLAIYDEVRAEQAQGAEFIPDRLVLGAVEAGSRRLPEWKPFEGELDNLKVEDAYRTDFSDLDSAPARTDAARDSFTRTVFESARAARLSAPVDNQRNCLLPCSGSASARWCSLRTGGLSAVSARLDVRPGDAREARLSAPAASEAGGAAAGCGAAESAREAHGRASAPAASERDVSCRASGSALSACACSLTCSAGALSGREGRLHCRGAAGVERAARSAGLAAAESERGGSCPALPGCLSERGAASAGAEGPARVRTRDARGAAMRARRSAVSSRGARETAWDEGWSPVWAMLSASLPAGDFAAAALPASGSASSGRGAETPCDLPRSSAPASLVAADYEGADWLSHLLAWMRECCEGDDELAPVAEKGFEARGFAALARPLVLAGAEAFRREEAAGAVWTAELEFEVRPPGGPRDAARLAARFVRALSGALARGAPPGAAGPMELETRLSRGRSGRFARPPRLRIRCRALVRPAAALI